MRRKDRRRHPLYPSEQQILHDSDKPSLVAAPESLDRLIRPEFLQRSAISLRCCPKVLFAVVVALFRTGQPETGDGISCLINYV